MYPTSKYYVCTKVQDKAPSMEMDWHIVGFSLFVRFIDKNKNLE